MTGRRIRFVVLLLVLAAVVGGGTYTLTRSTQTDILLEPTNSVGPHPFTIPAVKPIPSTTTTTAVGETTTTALYGGTGSQTRCDPDALLAFLMAHVDNTKAWGAALNDDPMLRWSTDQPPSTVYVQLTVADIPAYIAGLTPTF